MFYQILKPPLLNMINYLSTHIYLDIYAMSLCNPICSSEEDVSKSRP